MCCVLRRNVDDCGLGVGERCCDDDCWVRGNGRCESLNVDRR